MERIEDAVRPLVIIPLVLGAFLSLFLAWILYTDPQPLFENRHPFWALILLFVAGSAIYKIVQIIREG